MRAAALTLLLLALSSGGLRADGGAGADSDLERRLQRHSACTADSQCRSLGVGARPCGGPAGWRVYSVAGMKKGEEAALLRQAQSEAEAQRRQQAAGGRAGICQVLPDPGAYCELSSKRCQPGP